MSDRYDAIVIGTGPAGETAVSRLVAQGVQVALCARDIEQNSRLEVVASQPLVLPHQHVVRAA